MKRLKRRKYNHLKNYGMMATKAMILLVGERRAANEMTRRRLLKRKSFKVGINKLTPHNGEIEGLGAKKGR